MKRVMRRWQREMALYTFVRDKIALFVDPRLGKTLPIIRRILSLTPAPSSVLVVGPYSCLYGWEEQLRAEGEKSILYIEGTKKERLRRLRTGDARWFLLGKEGYLSLSTFNKRGVCLRSDLWDKDWDAIVIDESRFLGNPRNRVSRFYTRGFHNVRFKAILTGTPAPENEMEYFQQLKFLDPEILGYKDFYDWRRDNFILNEYTHEYVMKHTYKPYFNLALSKSCFFLRREDVRGITEKVYQTRAVRFPSKLHKAYLKLERDMILEIEGEEKSTVHGVVSYNWMRRLCGGFEDEDLVWRGKLDAMVEYIKSELPDEQIVVWCNFVAELNMVAEALAELGQTQVIYGKVPKEEREKIRIGFNHGYIKYVVGQPECFRFGTNLSAANVMIYYSSPLSSETRIQSEDRIIDTTKNEPVLVVDFIVRDTIEEDILYGLNRRLNKAEMLKKLARGMYERGKSSLR